MSLLRGKIRTRVDWWEVRLLDLDIVAEGSSEEEMIHELAFAITAEHHLALKHNRTPFVSLLRTAPPDVSRSWKEGTKGLRPLTLPEEVRIALAAVLREPMLPQFQSVDSDAEAA